MSSRSFPRSLLRPLERFGRVRVAVLGDFAADRYLIGKTSRISREAPVLILKTREESVLPGQAGNSAANLAALGVRCAVFGVIGDDRDGDRLRRSLTQRGIDASGIIVSPGGRTITKTRVLAGSHHTSLQQVIRLDDDEALPIPSVVRRRLTESLLSRLDEFDAVLVSDYGYGVVDESIWRRLATARRRRAGRSCPLLALDSRYALGRLKGADVITPNETEVFAQLGIEEFAGADPITAGRRLMRLAACRTMIMTRGNEGMLVFESRGASRPVPIFGSDEVTDVTGAGDTVAAVATSVLATGGKLIDAARLAGVAAGLVVMKRGAATVSPDELRAALAS
jgi:rfaE bifunctional protein kinase chain/domain